jgi:uncharacterized membrane protein YedE/YeeE
MSIIIEPIILEHAFAGGLLIGAAAGGLILVDGKIAGISFILANASGRNGLAWQWAFLMGLLTAGLAAAFAGEIAPPALGQESAWLLIPAGLLVGFGTRLGNGCTSGHGVCGISRLSRRSLAATGMFMASAAATVFLLRHVLGGL